MWTKDEVENAIKLVKEKASIDSNFRKLILDNPNKAIKEVTGKDVPEGYTIKIIENQSGIDQTYVLPDLQSDELDDADLDAVAGGGCKHCTSECGKDCNVYCPNDK